MSKQLKQMMRVELEQTFQKVDGGLLLNTQALDSEGQFNFRKAMHQRKLSYTVVKNSVAAQAFKGKGYKIDELNKAFAGPIGILYSEETASAIVSAKALTSWPEWKKIVKDKKIEIRGALLDGAVLNPKQAEQLKTAKGKKEMQAELAGVLQAPIQKFAATLQEIYARLAYAVEAVKTKKEGK